MVKTTKANRFAHNKAVFIDKARLRLYNLTIKALVIFDTYTKMPENYKLKLKKGKANRYAKMRIGGIKKISEVP